MPKNAPTFSKPSSNLETIPGRVILKLSQGPIRASLGRPVTLARQEANRVPAELTDPIDYLERNAGLTSIRPLFSKRRQEVAALGFSTGENARLAVLSSFEHSENEDLAGIVVADIAGPKLRPEVLKTIEASSAIEYVEAMPARWLLAAPATKDPMLDDQWNLPAIAWSSSGRASAKGVTIGVLDTGVDQGHPDLVGRTVRYEHGTESATDSIGHGTHVSGIIAALIDNGEGIAGVADCPLNMWKIFRDGSEYVDDELYFQGLRTIRDLSLAAINLSIGGTYHSRTEALLLKRLIDRGTVVVAAMGNDGNSVSNYPAAHPGVVAVGACGQNLDRADFSNTGDHITLIAPGVAIPSTVPVGAAHPPYQAWAGTSMATPHVTAAVALLKAQDSKLTASDVVQTLIRNARKVPGMKGQSWTPEYGHGLLNLGLAVS